MPKRSSRRQRAPSISKHLELDQRTGVLDVAVLDVLSQAEFLLNRAREIQRQILLVRGIGGERGIRRRRVAARTVEHIANEMHGESRQLEQVLRHLRRSAKMLNRAAA
jgi:hypothetical protein